MSVLQYTGHQFFASGGRIWHDSALFSRLNRHQDSNSDPSCDECEVNNYLSYNYIQQWTLSNRTATALTSDLQYTILPAV
jgi:hypothetical protein